MNKAIICGNLGSDPDVRTTGGGAVVAELRVAVTERRKVRGEWQDHTEWFTVVAWNTQAQNCQEYLRKGSQVLVEGRLQTRSWETDSGEKRYKTEIVAAPGGIRFLRGGADRGGSSGGGGRPPQQSGGGGTFSDDEIPF